MTILWIVCVASAVLAPGWLVYTVRDAYQSKALGVHNCNTQAWPPLSLLVADFTAVGFGIAAVAIAVLLFRRTPRIWAKLIAAVAVMLAVAAITLVCWVFLSQDIPEYQHGYSPIPGCTRDTPVTPEPSHDA